MGCLVCAVRDLCNFVPADGGPFENEPGHVKDGESSHEVIPFFEKQEPVMKPSLAVSCLIYLISFSLIAG